MDFADTFSDAPTDAVPAPSPSSSKRKTGRKKFRETRHPVYRGVRQRNGDKWVCEVREPRNQSRIWLGTFPSPEMAARAHDAAVLALRGDSARLNFEDSPQVLPRARSTSPADVQAAALAAAEMFRPNGAGHSGEAEERVVDEEEVFNRPALLADMAEGLLMAPPHVQKGYYWEEGDTQEFSLWNY